MIRYQKIIKILLNSLTVFVFLICFSCNLFAIAYTSIKLNNGLRVLLIQIKSPLVYYNVTYSVGTLEDNCYDQGLTFILEKAHLLGTNKYSMDQIEQIIDSTGAVYKSYIGRNYTSFIYSFPIEYLEHIMDIERDKMQWLKFVQSDIDYVKNIIITDYNNDKNNPEKIFIKSFASHAYPYASEGRDDIIDIHQFNQISAKRVKDFYQTWYVPNNANIVIVGDIDIDFVTKIIKDKYDSIMPNNKLFKLSYNDLEYEYESDVKIEYKSKLLRNSIFLKSFLVPSWFSAQKHTDVYALDIIAEYLSSKNNILKKYFSDHNLISDIKINYEKYKKGNTIFSFFIEGNKHTDINTVRKALNDQLEHIKQVKISSSERYKAINNIIDKFELSKENILDFTLLTGIKMSLGMSVYEIMQPRKYYLQITDEELNTVYQNLINSHSIEGFATN